MCSSSCFLRSGPALTKFLAPNRWAGNALQQRLADRTNRFYTGGVWDVEYTDQFGAWYATLTDAEQDVIEASVNVLITNGPDLGRPLVDRIRRSTIQNLKELRPPSTSLRVLFVFDPRRCAILLLGGNKARQWKAWYDRNIPIAEELYAAHLRALREEGVL
jgi:hypothetical protein